MNKQQSSRLVQYVSYAEAGYYVLTGVWPLVHINSFMKLTGRKVDTWLVKTVGALVTAIGATVGYAAYKREAVDETALLSIGSAAGLAAVDVVYVAKRRIRPIYLLDAVAEVGLIVLWVTAWMSRRRR